MAPPQARWRIMSALQTLMGEQSSGSSEVLPDDNHRHASRTTKPSDPHLVYESPFQTPFCPFSTTPRLPVFGQTTFVSRQQIPESGQTTPASGQRSIQNGMAHSLQQEVAKVGQEKKDVVAGNHHILDQLANLQTKVSALEARSTNLSCQLAEHNFTGSSKLITPFSSADIARGIERPPSTPGTRSEIQKLKEELAKCQEKISSLQGNHGTEALLVNPAPLSGTHPSISIVELRLGHEIEILKESYRILQEEHNGQTTIVQEYMSKITSLEKDKEMYRDLVDRYKAEASGSPAGVNTQAPNAKRPATPLQSGTSKKSKSAHAPNDLSDTPQVIDKPKSFLPTNRQFECMIAGTSINEPECMPSTQLHQAISEAVMSQMKAWEKRNRSSSAWEWRKLNSSGACIHTAVVNKKSGHTQRWTEFDRACAKCTESKQPCMKVHVNSDGKQIVALLPLPNAERGNTSEMDPGFWVRQ